MLLILLLLTSGLASISAQVVGGVDITKLPICAQGCIANNTGAALGCSVTDVHCLCSSISYINALSCCLEKACNTTEQRAALTFDIDLCNGVNVSIPNFLGCSPLSISVMVPLASAIPTFTFPTQAASSPAATGALVTITNVESAFTTTSGGPVATFGGNLLVGICTVPHLAAFTASSGTIVEFPWIGCSHATPGCCPFPLSAQGPLSSCPSDYVTTAGACCPSGWSIYTSDIASQTPCYTTLVLPLTPPTAANSLPSASIITTALFTTRYLLSTTTPSLSSGTIAGIVIGALLGTVLFAAALVILMRRRLAHSQAIRDATLIRAPYADSSDTPGHPSSASPASPGKHSFGALFPQNGPYLSELTTSMAQQQLQMTQMSQQQQQQLYQQQMPASPHPSPRTPSQLGSEHGFWRGPSVSPGSSPPMSPPSDQGVGLDLGMASGMGMSMGGVEGQGGVMELPGSTFLHEHHPIYAPGDGKG